MMDVKMNIFKSQMKGIDSGEGLTLETSAPPPLLYIFGLGTEGRY